MASEEMRSRPGWIRRTMGRAGRVVKFVYLGDTSEVRDTHEYFKRRMHRVLHPGLYARHETFGEACDRLGVTAGDVERRIAELRSAGLLYKAIALVAFAVFCMMPVVAHPISHGVMSTLVLAVALAKASVLRWRQAQCEQRTLMPYAAFWRKWWAR